MNIDVRVFIERTTAVCGKRGECGAAHNNDMSTNGRKEVAES